MTNIEQNNSNQSNDEDIVNESTLKKREFEKEINSDDRENVPIDKLISDNEIDDDVKDDIKESIE